MSEKTFDGAKNTIVELLELGVPPEHFLEIGINRETIFHAFTELKIKLPRNLDISDLTPYHAPPYIHIETEDETVLGNTEEADDTYDNAVRQELDTDDEARRLQLQCFG